MKTNQILCALALAASTISAFAQPAAPSDGSRPPGRPPTPPPIVALDTDRDGTISAEELKNATASLKTLDKDGDGALSPEELRPPGPPPRENSNPQPEPPPGAGDGE